MHDRVSGLTLHEMLWLRITLQMNNFSMPPFAAYYISSMNMFL